VGSQPSGRNARHTPRRQATLIQQVAVIARISTRDPFVVGQGPRDCAQA
jgi:hypothetical protein